MHRAVEARLIDPNISLLQALTKGGFLFPLDVKGNFCAKTLVDSDNIHLQQRKNQLSRRLRNIRKKQIKRVKENLSLPNQKMGCKNPSSNSVLRYPNEHCPIHTRHSLKNFADTTSPSFDISAQARKAIEIATLKQSNALQKTVWNYPRRQKGSSFPSRNKWSFPEQALLYPKVHHFPLMSQNPNIFGNDGRQRVEPTNNSYHATQRVTSPNQDLQVVITQLDNTPSPVHLPFDDSKFYPLDGNLKTIRNDKMGEAITTSYDEKLRLAAKLFVARRIHLLKDCLVDAGFEDCEVDHPHLMQSLEKMQES